MDFLPLPKLLDEVFEWISESDFPIGTRILGLRIPWTVSQLHVIHDYVSKLGVDSDISLRLYRKWGLSEVWQGRFEEQSYKDVSQMVVSFVEDLEELFKVPKVAQLPDSDEGSVLKRNELATVFIGFLFLIQQHGRRSDLVNSQVMEELRCLVAILGDTPFHATEDEQVQNLWGEFEGLASEAGRLVHSFIFAPDRVSDETMEESVVVLFQSIERLKANLVNFSSSLPNIPNLMANNYRRVNSLFIVDSLACDLEDLMNRDDDRIVEIKDQIKMVHQGLMLAQPLIKDINMSQDSTIEELKEQMMEIRDVAYEAEYLINSFLVGDVPLRYLTIRLNHFIQNIKLMGTMLQEMKAKYDVVALKFGEDSVQQTKRITGTSKMEDDIIVGFEEHESNIMAQLLGGRHQLQIISIFGMPGVGKTTLAKKSYNNPLVSCHFDRSVWCVVSQMYEKKKSIDRYFNMSWMSSRQRYNLEFG